MSIIKRIEKVQNYLISKELDFLIIEEKTDLFYLTGLKLTFGYLIISKTDATLFVDGRYIEIAKEKFLLSSEIYNTQNVTFFLKKQNTGKDIFIGFDSSYTSYFSYLKIKDFLKRLSFDLDKAKSFFLNPIEKPLKKIRMVKESLEITCLKKAAEINWKGFEYICSKLKEGVTEKKIAFEYEMFVRENGSDKLAFDPIICFGKNSSKPHHIPDDAKLKQGDIVLIDIGCMYMNYASDMTRCIFFNSQNNELEKIYSIVKIAQKKALEICKPGTFVSDLDKVARDYIIEKGYEKEFMHSLGHGVGLEVHEYPRVRQDKNEKILLTPGMVITIEPGIYLENVGGVRYEDTILITKDGYENLYTYS